MAKKYYAVAKGRNVGVYTDWASAEREVKGFAGAKYKGFRSEAEARAWLENPVYVKSKQKKRRSPEDVPFVADDNTLVVYTDGGCINNPGPGGYGVVIEDTGEYRELSGGYRLTTNNRMEMMASIVALQELAKMKRPICLFSDSSYLVNGMSKGWAKRWREGGWKKSNGEPAVNKDLWEELLSLAEACDVQFRWVKGHAGNPLNERCDQLAVAAARENVNRVDSGYER